MTGVDEFVALLDDTTKRALAGALANQDRKVEPARMVDGAGRPYDAQRAADARQRETESVRRFNERIAAGGTGRELDGVRAHNARVAARRDAELEALKRQRLEDGLTLDPRSL